MERRPLVDVIQELDIEITGIEDEHSREVAEATANWLGSISGRMATDAEIEDHKAEVAAIRRGDA